MIARSYRRTLRGKVMLPAAVLFVAFALAAVVGYTRQTTRDMEQAAEETLRREAELFDHVLAEERERVALQSRFLADMIELSSALPSSADGRPIVLSLIDRLGQQPVRSRVVTRGDSDRGDSAPSLPDGHGSGSSTALMTVDGGRAVSFASVAPVEHPDAIGDVVVSEIDIDESFLRSHEPKMSTEASVIVAGRALASTIEDPACVDAVRAAVPVGVDLESLAPGDVVLRRTECAGVPQHVLVRPLLAGSHTHAVYALSMSMDGLLAARSTILRNTVVGAAIALAIALLVYSGIVRRVTGPLGRLSALTRRVAEGDLSVRARSDTRDEVGELGDAFNLMIDKLRESRERIEAFHRQELEQADRLATVGELAAGVAHEIRNPLAGISGAVHILREKFRDLDDEGEILDEVLHQIERMNKLTTDLVSYSRPRDPEPQPYCINQVIEEALSLLGSASRDSRAIVRKDYASQLPRVLVDPPQMRQVLLNVLMNATQAMPDGGSIDVRTVHEDGAGGLESVVVEIRDRGPGVPEDILRRAKRPFVTTKHRGTGLGLAIAERIVDTHGGALSIENAADGGALVTVRLPALETTSGTDERREPRDGRGDAATG